MSVHGARTSKQVMLEQEQASREFGDDAVRREAEESRIALRRVAQINEDKLESLESAIIDVKHGIHEEAPARGKQAQDSIHRAARAHM